MIVHYVSVLLVDVGIALLFLGVVSLVRPLRFLWISSRRTALRPLIAAVVLLLVGASLPASETRVETPSTLLDEFIPVYQFSEHHEIRIAAPPERTFEAIRSVTAGEIALFRTLTAIRRGGRSGPESVLNAPENLPILDVATQTSFVLLAEDANREIVIGTLVAAPGVMPPRDQQTPDWFEALSGPGYAKAVMNFRVEGDGATRRTTLSGRAAVCA